MFPITTKRFTGNFPLIILLIVVGYAIYSNNLDVPFYFDDKGNIERNEKIQLKEFDFIDLIKSGFGNYNKGRALAYISFALNYYFHQKDILGYHIVNNTIHIINGVLLYLLMKTTLTKTSVRFEYMRNSIMAFLAAFVWMAHPIQTQSVTYIVQRMNSLAALFYILSLLFYARGRLVAKSKRNWPWFVCCIISGILSFGCKEVVITLPIFIFLYEWYFFQDLSFSWFKRKLPYLIIIITLLALIVFAYFFVHLDSNPWKYIVSSYGRREFSLIERVLTQFRIVVFYISLLAYPNPSRLNLDHYFPISTSFTEPITTVLSMGIVFALIVLAILIAKREALISFCIIWFFGNLVVESTIFPLELIFEHRTYIPSMFFYLLIAVIISKAGPLNKNWVIPGIFCPTILLFSVWTYQRNEIWREPVAFWSDCAKKATKNVRPNYNLANALAKEGRLDEAVFYYYRVLKIRSHHEKALINLGNVFAEQGEFEEAEAYYTKALDIVPFDQIAHFNLGNVLVEQGKIDEAVEHLSMALKIDPNFEEAHNEMGIVMIKEGKFQEAVEHFSKTLKINPGFAFAHYNLGKFLDSQGKSQEAVEHFSEVVKINPDFAQAHVELGIALSDQGDYQGAIDHFYEALNVNPDYALAHYNLGSVLARQGKIQEAIDHYYEALEINPENPEVHNNMGSALFLLGKSQEAIDHFSKALHIEPNYEIAHFNLGSVFAKQGRFQEAIDNFSEALRINPHFLEARSGLKKILVLQKD